MIVQACLNGARQPGSHPRLPTDPAALAADAAAVVQAGAHEIHLHVRRPDGRESLAPADVDATMAAVRAAIPGTLVGISTGAWIERDDDRRLAYMAAWRELPDYASVNLSELGAPAVIERLHRMGIGIEAGLASTADAERLVRLGLARLSLRMLIEIDEQDLARGHGRGRRHPRRPRRGRRAQAHPPPRLRRHGLALRRARLRPRLLTRVGLEDGSALPDGTVAASNAALVEAGLGFLRRPRG